jgi:hypothetical protein
MSIAYEPPKGWFYRLLSFLFGGIVLQLVSEQYAE